MEAKYYIIINGQQRGPYRVEDLRYYRIGPDTYVWREGLDSWVQAKVLPELQELVYGRSEEAGPAGPAEAGNFGRREETPHGGYSQEPPRSISHTNWQPWAIVATVLGCCTSCISLVLGIIALVQANNANRYYSYGNFMEGDRCNSTARVLCIIAFVLSGLSIIGSLALLRTGAYATLLSALD